MSWYAVYTKSRHERKVNTHLIQEGITAFLPEIERWSSRRDRRKQVWYPIFPGYLFINTELSAESRLKVIKTKGVVRILGHRGIPAAIPEHQIESIQKAIDSRKTICSFPYLKTGQIVRVVSGPLDGVEGIFVSEKGKGKLIISVDILQRSVAVEIEETDVESVQSLSLSRP
jgi:transcriptional antiterminator NusG